MSERAGKVAILVEDNYEDHELWYPYYRLREAGYETLLVAPHQGVYTSKAGYPASAKLVAAAVRPEDYAGVVVPGGYAPDRLRRYKDVLEFVRLMDEQGKLVGAICHAGWVLVSAGVLHGRRVTSFFSIKDDMVNAGAEWVDEEAVVDRNLVTSRYPADLPAFGRALVEVLARD